MTEITLREPGNDDWPAILVLAQLSLAELPIVPCQDEWLRNRMLFSQADGIQQHFVAASGERIVGYACAEHRNQAADGVYRLLVVVEPSARGEDETARKAPRIPYIGVVGRASGYQIYQGGGWDNPLTDHPGTRPRKFGVFMGGLDLLPFQGTSLAILGGRDVPDSSDARIEGDFSSWIQLHSRHPINVFFSGDHFYNNGQSSGMIDVRVVMSTSRELTWLLSAAGLLWGGGSEPHVTKEFGPDLGLFFQTMADRPRSSGRLWQ